MGIQWAELTEDEWLKKAEQQIWLSAFASNNPRAPAHKEADAAHDDAESRGAPWMYQRAWNSAYQSCGYTPSDEEVRLAARPTQEGA